MYKVMGLQIVALFILMVVLSMFVTFKVFLILCGIVAVTGAVLIYTVQGEFDGVQLMFGIMFLFSGMLSFVGGTAAYICTHY